MKAWAITYKMRSYVGEFHEAHEVWRDIVLSASMENPKESVQYFWDALRPNTHIVDEIIECREATEWERANPIQRLILWDYPNLEAK